MRLIVGGLLCCIGRVRCVDGGLLRLFGGALLRFGSLLRLGGLLRSVVRGLSRSIGGILFRCVPIGVSRCLFGGLLCSGGSRLRSLELFRCISGRCLRGLERLCCIGGGFSRRVRCFPGGRCRSGM